MKIKKKRLCELIEKQKKEGLNQNEENELEEINSNRLNELIPISKKFLKQLDEKPKSEKERKAIKKLMRTSHQKSKLAFGDCEDCLI